MKIRIFSVVCLLLALTMVFSACGSAAAVNPGNSVLFEQVAGDGTFAYDLVRSADSNDEYESMMVELRKSLKKGLGLKVVLQRDTVEDTEGKYELLIGNTNRQESIDCLAQVTNYRTNNLKDFLIKCIGHKICIVAVTDESLKTAVDLFVKTFCGSAEDWAKLGTNFEYHYAPEATGVHLVSDHNLGEYTIVTKDKSPFIYMYYVEELDKVYADYNYVSLRAADTDAPTDLEILIGDTDRPESKAVSVSGNDYVLKVEGTKLVIKGGTDLATSHGVQKLLSLIDENPGGINLKDGYVFNGNVADSPDSFQLVMGEEFNGSTFNNKLWGSFCNQSSVTDGSIDKTLFTASRFGGAVYYYGMSGCFLSDGKYVCTAGKLPGNDCYQSGITSIGKWGIRYGIVDIWAKCAPAPVGTSYWFNGFENCGCMNEINLVETAGRDFMHVSNIHRWGTSRDENNISNGWFHTSVGGATYKTSKPPVLDEYLWENYHMWSMLWDKEGLHFAFDGKTFFNYELIKEPGQTSLHTRSHMHLVNHLGEAKYSNARGYDPAKDGTYFEGYVDYVHIYQNNEGDMSWTPQT